MRLSYNNCKIEITEEKIECEYLYLANKKIDWKIALTEKIIYQINSNETILIPQEIKEFQFEIEDISHRSSNLSQEAVIYYLKKGEFEATEFFRFCVIEETKLSSQTKSYEFANEILKIISNKYNIPFSFKYYVETKRKRDALSYLIVLIIFAFLFGLLANKL
ncbi:hypothetical protein ASF10_04360 [Flavobacterium sp. Leaf82]|uniref:hypothetical protein n=1 Tax=unclassified Flavobacterium TaxID=196869 RepID=UPI0006F73DAA|nr:hypothetical protein [Flavobacterium sp. Leaf82]KQO29750.1 hypothetical protein ASF10_04360 [Flavobacterium sp. Leaf82]